ncbi:MAG: prepilin-type N-terminal cleavage/methylation domain-containing protein [Candidatus Cohnella colombiensis]|uniref:Prepilin-type N-terminal cleavage/methylation domain-containing protein n=1 Tax=Candidatus Cohnella colombiensis TaxID=3121368 RepID=A0AA95EVA0_9BACL|nr:MAG: prepilin-type N-terminal cleavage/methylation domain-containing protein [Cohnella sp.]
MSKLANQLQDERGNTLVEMIAALTIMSLIMGTIYAVITFGFDSYHRVNIENSLRDEGDLLMSSVISEMYTYGPDLIMRVKNDANNEVGIKLVRTLDSETVDPVIIKIENNALYIDSTAIEIKSKVDSESRIVVSCPGDDVSGEESNSSKLSHCNSGLIMIKLVLEQQYKSNNQTLELESKFGF